MKLFCSQFLHEETMSLCFAWVRLRTRNKKPEFRDISQAAQYVPVLPIEIVFPDLLNWYETLISSQKDTLFPYFDNAEPHK